jgi:hypothetical protein
LLKAIPATHGLQSFIHTLLGAFASTAGGIGRISFRVGEQGQAEHGYA